MTTQERVYPLRGLRASDLGAVGGGNHQNLKIYFQNDQETGCMLTADGNGVNLVVTGHCAYNPASMVRYLNQRFGKRVAFRDVKAGQVRRGQ